VMNLKVARGCLWPCAPHSWKGPTLDALIRGSEMLFLYHFRRCHDVASGERASCFNVSGIPRQRTSSPTGQDHNRWIDCALFSSPYLSFALSYFSRTLAWLNVGGFGGKVAGRKDEGKHGALSGHSLLTQTLMQMEKSLYIYIVKQERQDKSKVNRRVAYVATLRVPLPLPLWPTLLPAPVPALALLRGLRI